MTFYLLALLLPMVTATSTYNISNAIISDITSATKSSGVSLNCGKLLARSNQLYHLKTNNTLLCLQKGTFILTDSTTSTSSRPLLTFAVNQEETHSVIAFDDSINNMRTTSIALITYSQVWYTNITMSLPLPSFVELNSSTICTLTIDTNNSNSILILQNLVGSHILAPFLIPLSYTKMVTTPDFNKIFVWGASGEITVIQMSDFANLSYLTPNSPISSNAMDSITFSLDSSMAILQTDHHNPILIINLTSYANLYSIIVNDIIHQVHFLNSSNSHLLVRTMSNLILIDLNTLVQYPMPALTAITYTADSQNSYFICNNNVLEQHYLEIVESPTSNTTSNTTSQDPQQQTTEQSGPSESDFYTTLNISSMEETFQTVNDTLSATTLITSSVSTALTTLPISIYFLGFLNYLTMCSLYCLLNFPLPEQLYQYLALLYNEINKNFLAIFGIELQISSLSSEKVDSPRGLFFGVSSDFVSSNLVSFIFLLLNLVFITLMHLFTSCLRRKNFLRKMMSNHRWEMMSGQVVNLMAPILLPWTFVMMDLGVRDFNTKLNTVGYLLIYFMALVFPIYYFFELLEQREGVLIKVREQAAKKEEIQSRKRAKAERSLSQGRKGKVSRKKDEKKSMKQGTNKSGSVSKEKTKSLKKIKTPNKKDTQKNAQSCSHKNGRYPNYTYKIVFPDGQQTAIDPFKPVKKSILTQKQTKPTQPTKPIEHNKPIEPRKQVVIKKKEIGFGELINGEVLQKWHLVQTNFLLPCLVLITNPVYFLIVICLYSFLGVVIALRKNEQCLNSFFLALYPFLFHLCFMVFYWSKSVNVLIYTQLICLMVILIGSLHHLLTVLFELCAFGVKIIKKLCKGNKIDPTSSQEVKRNKKNEQKKEGTKKEEKKEKKKGIKEKSVSPEILELRMDKKEKQLKGTPVKQKKVRENKGLKVVFPGIIE